MLGKIFALFALLAVAFAAPGPKPDPKPQLLYSAAGLDYAAYPYAAVPSAYSAYSAPLAYSAYPGAYYLR